TLRAEPGSMGPSQAWSLQDCLDIGLRLAEALGHLHHHGLAHRDVKPSNIIFVNGNPKLADIGLVAARGQRTFVGTEGFVPPEGPGSAQADIYSLGKVLYEIATGMDRLNFPELPEEVPGGSERRQWLELNRLICDVCEPRISHRNITTADQLADALRRIKRGRRGRRSNLHVWAASCLLTVLSGLAIWHISRDIGWIGSDPPASGTPAAPKIGQFRIFSTPEGADVIDDSGRMLGTTPTRTLRAKVGEEMLFTLRRSGYQDSTVRANLDKSSIQEPMVILAEMKPFQPPVVGRSWMDPFGIRYMPQGDQHLSRQWVERDAWEKFLSDTAVAMQRDQLTSEFLALSENGTPLDVVLVTKNDARAFCRWLRALAILEGRLTHEFDLEPMIEDEFEHPALSAKAAATDLKPFRILVRRFAPGTLTLTSDPPGADVYLDGQFVGSADTTLSLSGLRPGNMSLKLVLEGYKPLVRTIEIAEGMTLDQNLTLQKNQGVVFGKPWENGLRMRFVPIHPDLMGSVWETRICDFDLFLAETGAAPPPAPPFAQAPEHPVVNISRAQARAFCDWLTRRERGQERIAATHQYRLPSDLEWSLMAGLEDDFGVSPGGRDARKQHRFPWGLAWPPPRHIPGNFADQSAADMMVFPSDRTIAGYRDGHPHTAPVGSFPANALGIHDLSGNVQEWVDDGYSSSASDTLGVLRGGSWNTYQPENLFSGSRNAVPPDYQDVYYGFRIVLAKIPRRTEK
ncbi:MAG: SUMF1/EgtB/PvdO family nonheme iron enzyme, partial [Luteolibacter sp.]